MKTHAAFLLITTSLTLASATAFADDPRPPVFPDDRFVSACHDMAPAGPDQAGYRAFLASCVAGAKHAAAADAMLHETCAATAPQHLEMTARWKLVDTCVADAQRATSNAKLRQRCTAKAPRSSRREFIAACIADAKEAATDSAVHDACAARMPKGLEMSSRRERIDQCVADAKQAAEVAFHDDCAAHAPAELEMSSRREFITTCVADAKVFDGPPVAKRVVTKPVSPTSNDREYCAAKAMTDPDPRSQKMFIDMCVDQLRSHPEQR